MYLSTYFIRYYNMYVNYYSFLTFAMLSGVKPEYPQSNDLNRQVASSSSTSQTGVTGSSAKTNVILAKKSTVPTSTINLTADSNNSNPNMARNLSMIVGRTISDPTPMDPGHQLSQSQISLPAGTCIVPAGNSSTAVNAANQQLSTAISSSLTPQQNLTANPMTITLQYKVYSGAKGQPETVAVKRDLAELINEAPSDLGQSTIDLDSSGRDSSTPTITGTPTPSLSGNNNQASQYDPSNLPPLPVDNNDADLVLKDTMKVKNSAGESFDIPTVVTSGYSLDSMSCTLCDKSFKNDKTLMGHMISHFGVTPKMAKCPICGLTLQKKSYARHLRLHGDIVPEVCQYCKKEFREKRSLDKHIRAIHSSDKPYNCNHCSETFRTKVQQENHMSSHMRDFSHKCDRCQMTFRKQEELNTHYRTHLEQKSYICEVCEKAFNSEKNMRQHAIKHQGELPHKCEICMMTFQSRSQLIRHATSHVKDKSETAFQGTGIPLQVSSVNQTHFTTDSSGSISSNQTHAVSAKINTFLESFSAELENELGLDDAFSNTDQQQQEVHGVSMNVSEVEVIPTDMESKIVNQITTTSEFADDGSMRLSMDTIPGSLEDAAAEAAFVFGQHDLPEDILGGNEAESDAANAGGSEDSNNTSGFAAKSETKTLQCDICMAKLKNARSYIVHMKRHAGTISLRCRLCPEVFQGNMKLKKHMRTQHGPDTVNLNPIVLEDEDSQSSTTSSTASTKMVPSLAATPATTPSNTVVSSAPVVAKVSVLPTGINMITQ